MNPDTYISEDYVVPFSPCTRENFMLMNDNAWPQARMHLIKRQNSYFSNRELNKQNLFNKELYSGFSSNFSYSIRIF